ncbi:hypothetical protein PIB30_095748 [Stylosanthes scabra]|uniref:PRONE domain-containing protein n=1 Tax=Stylosanthes scabra TaxID=79078 RepID=A0ABU6YTK2_9FABA|nr:hypothetical protein [Stylosanthes scabra]
MSALTKKSEESRKKRYGFVKKESLTDSTAESRESNFGGSNSSSSGSSIEEAKATTKASSSPSPPAPPLGWPILKAAVSKCGKSDAKEQEQEQDLVVLVQKCQMLNDEGKVMTCRPRTDIFINVPALRKLDNMLLDILDTEFWYVDQGIVAPDADGSASFHKTIQRQDGKWWLPVPRVPPKAVVSSLSGPSLQFSNASYSYSSERLTTQEVSD